MFPKGKKADASLGMAFAYGDGELPQWALLAEMDNGTASGKGTTDYVWLPTEDGNAIPVGMFRRGAMYAVHTDHLGTPRLITDSANKPVWQWVYSAFGDNKPTGVLATASTNGQTQIKATKPSVDMPLRDPGQYDDEETGMRQNFHRYYRQKEGRYGQSDPTGTAGGATGSSMWRATRCR